MKKHFPLFFLFLFMLSCSKNNNSVSPQTINFHNANGLYVNFTGTQWYTLKDGSSVTLNLKMTGNTNGDKITMTTNGDGLISNINVDLQSNKTFSKDIAVYFTANGTSPGNFNGSTQITVSKGIDTLIATLKSGNVSY